MLLITGLWAYAAGYLVTPSDSSDDDSGIGSVLMTVVGSVLAFVIIMFAGSALLLYLGIGEAIVKPFFGLIRGYVEAVFGLLNALVSPVVKLLGVV